MIPGEYEKNNLYWWKQKDKSKIHEDVFAKVKHMDQNQNYRSADNLRHMRLYGNYEMLGLHAYQYARTETSYNTTHRVTLNVVQSMIDTVVSKIGKNRPKPMFLTDGGDWSLQSKAKKLNQFVEGQFHATELWEKAALAFQDACIFGTGALKIFRDGENIKVERVFIDEILVDDAEAYYSEPRQLHQRKYINREVLLEMFPDKKSFIKNTGKTRRS